MRRPMTHKRELAHYFEYSPVGIEVVQDGLKEVRFGEYLVEKSALSRAQLFRALCAQDRNPGVRLGEIVSAMGIVPGERVSELLREFQGLPSTVGR